MGSLEVRRIATDEDLQHACRIREEVFMKEQSVSRADEFDGYDAESFHYLALIDGQPAGTARWRRTSKGIKLERFCVLPALRGLGAGRELVSKVMEDVTEAKRPGEVVYLHAQWDVVSLYAAAGFTAVGEEFVECEIRHQLMEFR